MPYVAVTSVALPHANPGLEPDGCLLLDDVDLQQVLPPLQNPPAQDRPPPVLDHPGPEGGRQQGAAHQGATPPGLDFPGRLDLGSAAFLA